MKHKEENQITKDRLCNKSITKSNSCIRKVKNVVCKYNCLNVCNCNILNYESGITLISLIIMIIILVILSAVTIRGLAGNTGIIDATQVASEEYKIEQYKEQVTELRENAIAEYSLMGKDITMESLAKLMYDGETVWPKDIHANIGDAETNDDIMVRTTDGYMYQIYYDELTGQKFIEYVGKGEEESLPKIKATYNKGDAELTFTAKDGKGIAKVEILHRGTIYTDNATDETETSIDGNGQTSLGKTVTLQKMGWYIVKVTSVTGYTRYAWIRVTSTVVAPTVEVVKDKSGTCNNGWYGADQKEVVVRIHTENETVTAICYKISVNGVSQGEKTVEGKVADNIKLPKNAGTITVTAYTTDEKGNISEIGELEPAVLYDNVKPTLRLNPDILITGTDGENGWKKGNVTISLANAGKEENDANSGVTKYHWWYVELDKDNDGDRKKIGTKGENTKTVDSLNRTIVEDRDGERVIGVQTEDIAGNKSTVVTINIKKDATNPAGFSAEVPDGERRPTYFIINASTTDNLSGNENRGYKLKYKYTITGQGQTITSGDTSNGGYIESTTYKAEGLKVNKSYTVYVDAKDEAGNVTRCTNTLNPSTYGELKAPIVKVEGPHSGNNDWFTGNPTKVEVKDGTSEDRTGVEKFKYKIDENGKENIFDPKNPPTITFPDGAHELIVWGEDPNGTKTQETKTTVRKDTKAPNPPTISPNDNTWKTTDTVTVTITRGTDQGEGSTGSGASKISYSGIDGQSSTGDVATKVTKTINSDGTFTVTAKTIDVAGNESTEAKATIKHDKTDPTVSISIGSLDTKTRKVTVTATGRDDASKIKSYTFQYKKTSDSAWTPAQTYNVTSSPATSTQKHTYELTAGYTYDLRVQITDNAGRVGYSDGTTSGEPQVSVPVLVSALSISPTSMDLNTTTNKTRTINATVSPTNATNKTVKWQSSDSNIATVDQSGNVTAKGKGTATITATTTDGTNMSAQCTVKVSKLVSSITLNPTSMSLDTTKNTTKTIKATVTPNDASNTGVDWKSNDTNVATVDATGKVTAKGKGSTTITATAKDGSKVTASCSVTVSILATKITVSPTTLSLNTSSNKTATIKATITPANVTNQALTWSANPTGIVTISGTGTTVTITANKEGNTTIKATTKDGTNLSASCTVTVSAYESVDTATSKVANYADIDGDGTVDGIIYADLAVGGSGQWGVSNYMKFTIPMVTTGLKKYIKKGTHTTTQFGTGDIIAPEPGTSGKERFYVMALSDLNSSNYYMWYYSASGSVGQTSPTSTDFGTGKENTRKMIEKWKNKSYGAQNAGEYKDLWDVAQVPYEKGWFVPSRGEWGAFGYYLNVTSDNYSAKGLKQSYWSSSSYGDSFTTIYMGYFGASRFASTQYSTDGWRARLSTTF